MASIPTGEILQPAIEELESSGKQPLTYKKYLMPFILVTSLFFFWGVAHNLDGILIPHLKDALFLNNRQSTLVDTAVFLAYFLMAIPAGYLLNRFGYKGGFIIGLLLFATGAFLFVPAANALSYGLFLGALFILGCGLATLETAANPYSAVLGPSASSSTRMNLAASFNGLGAWVGPTIGTIFILSDNKYTPEQAKALDPAAKLAYSSGLADSVKMPYIVLGIVLLLLVAVFALSKLPDVHGQEANQKPGTMRAALRHRHLVWSVIAQFFYVGAQVCVTSFFIRMAVQGGGITQKTAGYYLGVYGLLFMLGRFVGTFFLRFVKDHVLLAIYAIICVVLSIIAVTADGGLVVYALGGLGFFMSIQFPTIFSLGIRDIRSDTKMGSSLLVMSIVGGAIIPYIMGTVIDYNHDQVQTGYIVPMICYVVILLFALFGYKIKRA